MALDFFRGGIIYLFLDRTALDFLGRGCFREGLPASFEVIVSKGKKLEIRERRKEVWEFSLVFSDPFQAVGKIT